MENVSFSIVFLVEMRGVALESCEAFLSFAFVMLRKILRSPFYNLQRKPIVGESEPTPRPTDELGKMQSARKARYKAEIFHSRASCTDVPHPLISTTQKRDCERGKLVSGSRS